MGFLGEGWGMSLVIFQNHDLIISYLSYDKTRDTHGYPSVWYAFEPWNTEMFTAK